MKKYMLPATAEEKILQRRVADAVKAAGYSGRPQYLGFWNLREQELAQAELNKQCCTSYCFDGGFEGAERVMLCVFEDKEDVTFPMVFLHIEVSQAEKLTHRDYLGAVMAVGIKRECVGDIVADNKGATLIVQREIADFLVQELSEVGRESARVVYMDVATKPMLETSTSLYTASVASLRLDAVVAAMLHQSRTKSAALIAGGLVQVNHREISSQHTLVEPEDILSIRGFGKYRLENIIGTSRKNRVRIEYVEYQ